MHKFFKDLSFTGGVLFLVSLIFGLIFRYTGLADISSWSDEVATWYYAQNLGSIFQSDSHTPLYYFICKIWISIFPDTIFSLRLLSIFLSLLILSVSCLLIGRKSGIKSALIVFSSWWLWPSMVIQSRQARHYSFYLDMTLLILVMWDQKKNISQWIFWGALVIYQLIHPLAVIPVVFLCLWDLVKERKTKVFLFELSSMVPVALYYLSKFYFLGQEKVESHISWISSDTFHFFKSMLIVLAGDSFPFSKFYPVQIQGFLFLVGSVSLIVLIKSDWRRVLKNPWFIKSVLIFIGTELVVETLGLLDINLRVNRYYVYILGFFIFALYKVSEDWSEKQKLIRSGLIVGTLMSYSFIFQKPWLNYAWDDQIVQQYEEVISLLPPQDTVICANTFQLAYYFNLPESDHCLVQVERLIESKKPFYFFDLNGNDKLARAHLITHSTVNFFKKFDHSVFISTSPK